MTTAPAQAALDASGSSDPGMLALHERPEFIAWLAASCERNNVPVTVADPTVIARVATLLGAGRPARPSVHTRRARRARSISTPEIPETPEAMTA